MRFRKLTLALAGAAVIWGVATIAFLTYSTNAGTPDNLHADFGIPLTFAVHTTSNIAGPIDTWNVDMNALAGDLAFWLIGLIAIVLAGLTRNPKGAAPSS